MSDYQSFLAQVSADSYTRPLECILSRWWQESIKLSDCWGLGSREVGAEKEGPAPASGGGKRWSLLEGEAKMWCSCDFILANPTGALDPPGPGGDAKLGHNLYSLALAVPGCGLPSWATASSWYHWTRVSNPVAFNWGHSCLSGGTWQCWMLLVAMTAGVLLTLVRGGQGAARHPIMHRTASPSPNKELSGPKCQ